MQLIVQFRPELDVTYSNGVFRSSSAEAIEPINNILRSFPDAKHFFNGIHNLMK